MIAPSGCYSHFGANRRPTSKGTQRYGTLVSQTLFSGYAAFSALGYENEYAVMEHRGADEAHVTIAHAP